ncbi:hypothetical protein [Niveibacterium microcysteis]|uniref:Uncharacterized protein n=1 Tax=Niveibacterium microcysteis TaxID=2811415 RepID=A0ABX7MBU7_9RHOO|nr:hypothetical protein [Niveibacterium microcysteis]QSI78869.1 hypothetical protein JY500_09765 [Niveibacterium microcysteis]
MKSIVRNALRCAALALSLSGTVAVADGGTAMMTDPLLGLSFSPDTVRFPTWQDSHATRRDLGSGRKWVFGCAQSGDASTCVIAGMRTVKSDGGGEAVSEPDFGAVVYRRGTMQQVLGTPDRMFDAKPIVSERVRKALLNDAVARYIRAFGGQQALQAQINAQRLTREALPAPTAEALQAGGITVPAEAPR